MLNRIRPLLESDMYTVSMGGKIVYQGDSYTDANDLHNWCLRQPGYQLVEFRGPKGVMQQHSRREKMTIVIDGLLMLEQDNTDGLLYTDLIRIDDAIDTLREIRDKLASPVL